MRRAEWRTDRFLPYISECEFWTRHLPGWADTLRSRFESFVNTPILSCPYRQQISYVAIYRKYPFPYPLHHHHHHQRRRHHSRLLTRTGEGTSHHQRLASSRVAQHNTYGQPQRLSDSECCTAVQRQQMHRHPQLLTLIVCFVYPSQPTNHSGTDVSTSVCDRIGDGDIPHLQIPYLRRCL